MNDNQNTNNQNTHVSKLQEEAPELEAAFLDIELELLSDEDPDMVGAILENLKLLYNASAQVRDKIYSVLRHQLLEFDTQKPDTLDENIANRWTNVQCQIVEALILVGAAHLRDDEPMIVELSRLLLESAHPRLRRWAVAALSPATAAGNTRVIAILRYVANEMWDHEEVRLDAEALLEDLDIPRQTSGETDRHTLIELATWLFQGAWQLAMGFAGSHEQEAVRWTGSLMGHIYRKDGELTLRIVFESHHVGMLVIVPFKNGEGKTILRPALIRATRERVAFVDVSIEGIGAEGTIAPPRVVDGQTLQTPIILPLLHSAFAQTTNLNEHRPLIRQWMETLDPIPVPLQHLTQYLRARFPAEDDNYSLTSDIEAKEIKE